MTSSLVGSEMCIRDRLSRTTPSSWTGTTDCQEQGQGQKARRAKALLRFCLLYTSDAADDM
eukprot:8652631-Prorocentrum_lima.AAC.1